MDDIKDLCNTMMGLYQYSYSRQSVQTTINRHIGTGERDPM